MMAFSMQSDSLKSAKLLKCMNFDPREFHARAHKTRKFTKETQKIMPNLRITWKLTVSDEKNIKHC